MAYQLSQVETSAAPVREKVAKAMREAIVQGAFRPGERLIERELCEFTGVSRTSVREALRQLESEGLVEMIPHRGPVVATLTPEDARELYVVREVLEALAARLCAENATEAQVTTLRETVDAVAAAIVAEELGNLLVLKDDFYAALLDGAGNSVVTRMLTGLHGRVMFLRSQTLGDVDRREQSIHELWGIIEAIEQRDPDLAAQRCAEHVAHAGELAQRIFASTEADALPGDDGASGAGN